MGGWEYDVVSQYSKMEIKKTPVNTNIDKETHRPKGTSRIIHMTPVNGTVVLALTRVCQNIHGT